MIKLQEKRNVVINIYKEDITYDRYVIDIYIYYTNIYIIYII